MVARHRLSGEKTLLIGDMDHDAEVAAALGMSVALVARGHQDGERLRAVTARVFEDATALEREVIGDL
jgi:phosphoglycolate phosphatase-like HAD superfamily hydrolase